MTKKELTDQARTDHDTLSGAYYGGDSGLSKIDFDLQHGQIWIDLEAALIAGGFKETPIPPRDLEAEIDVLKVKIAKLEKK